MFPPSKTMRLEINERAVDFEFPDYNVLPTLSVLLLWTPDCEHLAFLDLRPPGTLVLIHANEVERKVRLPEEETLRLDGLTPGGNGLLLVGSKKTFIYDFRRNNVAEAPQVLLKQLETQRAARDQVLKKVGGESPDWFTDAPSSLSSK